MLKQYNRWPTWMWGNWEVAALTEWLKRYNQRLDKDKKVGFYGLDVYSLWESMEAILKYLEKVDPEALKSARKAFRCFEPYKGDNGRDYAHALHLVPELCEQEAMQMLNEIQHRMPHYDDDYEAAFSTEQNALVAVNAERYYRSMLEGGGASWNARDSHLQETLERVLDFYGKDSKAIIWAHNTHIGDALATDMASAGMYNIGQLARGVFTKKDVVLVGFGSYEGSVIAGSAWSGEMKAMSVPPAKAGSWEAILRKAGPSDKLLLMNDFKDPMFMNHIGHRAIGVVYDPDYERMSNYVPSILPARYDAFVYIDTTKALHPLPLKADSDQLPDTYPFGV